MNISMFILYMNKDMYIKLQKLIVVEALSKYICSRA
jgi:hypothetical protein